MRRASKGRDGKNRSGWNMDSNNENPAPQHKDALTTPPFDETYRRGPIIMRGRMVPKDTTYGNLLAPEASTDWLHMDPWRVMRIQAEFVDGFGALAELGPAVAVFGSARTAADDKMYAAARDAAAQVARAGCAVITGGGPGILEAANRGAAEAGGVSVGLGIELPFEEGLNPWVNGAMVFPGGFGTLDEMFELLTLVQTHKVKETPVALVGEDYWRGLFDWIEGTVRDAGMIGELDQRMV